MTYIITVEYLDQSKEIEMSEVKSNRAWRLECEALRAELTELRRFRKVIMDYDSNLYDALADSDAAHKGEGE